MGVDRLSKNRERRSAPAQLVTQRNRQPAVIVTVVQPVLGTEGPPQTAGFFGDSNSNSGEGTDAEMKADQREKSRKLLLSRI